MDRLSSRRSITLVAAVVCPLALTACVSDALEAAGEIADALSETGGGRTPDTTIAPDVGGLDAAGDEVDGAGEDAAVETGGPDIGDGSGSDAGPDAAVDVGEGSGDVGGDAEVDAEVDAGEDVVADVVEPRPVGCGDGVLGGREECDDGNDVNTDECTNACRRATCGDGITNRTLGRATVESPRLDLGEDGAGFLCDDGAHCPETSCDVSTVHYAAEHGICQALGYERALEVTWGGGEGTGTEGTLHAYRWDCFDYVCFPSDIADTGAPCDEYEMLASIKCEGIVGEECDDGPDNALEPGACRPDCTLPVCGDGIVDTDEECDDANRVADDGCSNNCLLPQCGDGVVQGDEDCDDGNDDDSDGCKSDCTEPFCGDGVVSATERVDTINGPTVTNPFGVTGRVCDDGATCQGSSCDVATNPTAPEHGICEALGYEQAESVRWGGGPGESDTSMPHAYNWVCAAFDCGPSTNSYSSDNCGSSEMLNTIVCRGGITEACDAGDANADTPGAPCRTDCTLPRCGDGVIDPGEDCDDGNDIADDGCSNLCLRPQCGDGVRQAGEECDDGNEDDTDGCLTGCVLPSCGDGIVSTFERTDTLEGPVVTNPFGARGRVCDDGATCFGADCDVSTNGSATEHGICQALGYDRAVRVNWGSGPGESDSPMPHAYNWTCSGFVCGPSGDSYSSDNCSSSEMLRDITCTGGFDEECDEGDENSMAPGAACRPTCRAPWCGDGVTDPGEECDDGNTVATDGCSNLCRTPRCGDGVVQVALGEECDDGNDIDDDLCSNICEFGAGRPPCADGDLGSAVGAGVISGTTVGAGSDLTSTCGASAASPELAYVWTAPSAGSFRFDTIGSTYDTVLYARNLGPSGVDCGGADLACNDDSSGVQSVINVSVTAGQRLLVVVDGYSSGSTGNFVLNISRP